MTSGFDELIERLLHDVALSGSQGKLCPVFSIQLWSLRIRPAATQNMSPSFWTQMLISLQVSASVSSTQRPTTFTMYGTSRRSKSNPWREMAIFCSPRRHL